MEYNNVGNSVEIGGPLTTVVTVIRITIIVAFFTTLYFSVCSFVNREFGPKFPNISGSGTVNWIITCWVCHFKLVILCGYLFTLSLSNDYSEIEMSYRKNS